MSDNEAELCCPICCETCCEPITTPCNHTFCRICLYQSTIIAPDGRHCPVCRSSVTVLDEQGALLPVDLDLEAVAKGLIPSTEYADRVKIAADAFAKLSATASEDLPVFYLSSGCNVGEQIALHLFEPRYKVLIRRALEGSRRFIFARATPQAAMRATVVQVGRAELLPDGRALVAGVGVDAVVLDKVWVAEGTSGLWMSSFQSRVALQSELPATPTSPRQDTPLLSHLPVFYGTGAFPRQGKQASLYLFEPRYRLMLGRVVAGSQQFVWSESGPEPGGEAGVVKVKRASFLNDGRAEVIVETLRKIRIEEAWQEEQLHGLYFCSFLNQAQSSTDSQAGTECRCAIM